MRQTAVVARVYVRYLHYSERALRGPLTTENAQLTSPSRETRGLESEKVAMRSTSVGSPVSDNGVGDWPRRRARLSCWIGHVSSTGGEAPTALIGRPLIDGACSSAFVGSTNKRLPNNNSRIPF